MEDQACPKQVAHKEGPQGWGWADHSTAGATGRAPPLPVSSTNGPEQLCLRQGEAAAHKNKNPKGGTSPAALEGCWSGNLGPQPGAGSHKGSQPCCHSGARRLPCPSGGVGVGGQTSWEPAGVGAGRWPLGPPAPMPQAWADGQVVGSPCGWQCPRCTHPASERRSSQRSPHPGLPNTSA